MKILYVITDLNTGGVPLHLLRLARYLSTRGVTVSVTSLAPPGPVSRLLEQADIETRTCGAVGAWDWRVIDRLARIIAEVQPDLVHSLLFHANVAARFAGLLCGFDRHKLICEIQTVEIERRWHLTVDAGTQQLCRCVVGNSPSVIEHLAERAHIARSRLRLVWGGVDLKAIRAAEPIPHEQLGIPACVPLMLWVGRLDPIKGLDVLVAAVGLLAGARGAHLAIVGEGPYRGHLERLVVSSAAAERIHLLGPRNDVPGLLKAADVFVFPSRTEGLPNALLEAMAAGLPVVTTDAPGCRDLVRDGQTGLVVPVDDARALAAAIDSLLADRELSARFGRLAVDHVRRNFLLEQCFDTYASLYGEVIHHRIG